MATTTRAQLLLSTVLGTTPKTVESYVRALQVAGLIRIGRRGGGKGGIQLDNLELATMTLAFAAPVPGEAVAAVTALSDLMGRRVVTWNSRQPPPQSLLNEMAMAIWAYGMTRLRGDEFARGLQLPDTWELQLCVSPAWARLEYEGPNGREALVFEGSDKAKPALRRLTILTGDVLSAMGDLWADSRSQQGLLDRITMPDDPAPENENGAPRKAPSPRATRTASKRFPDLNTPEANRYSDSAQGYRAGGPGHFPL